MHFTHLICVFDISLPFFLLFLSVIGSLRDDAERSGLTKLESYMSLERVRLSPGIGTVWYEYTNEWLNHCTLPVINRHLLYSKVYKTFDLTANNFLWFYKCCVTQDKKIMNWTLHSEHGLTWPTRTKIFNTPANARYIKHTHTQERTRISKTTC